MDYEPKDLRPSDGTGLTDPVPTPVVVPGGTPLLDALVLSPVLLRAILIALGGIMQRHGWISDPDINEAVSLGLIIIPAAWQLVRSKANLASRQTLADMLPDHKARVAGR